MANLDERMGNAGSVTRDGAVEVHENDTPAGETDVSENGIVTKGVVLQNTDSERERQKLIN